MKRFSIGKLVLILILSIIVFYFISIAQLEIKPPAASLNQTPFSYIRVCPSPYTYQTGPEEWQQIRLYANDPKDAETIQWILNQFEGTYSLNSVMLYQPATGSVWESIIFYDENDKEIDRITWKNLYEKGIFLTPNPTDTFTLLYDNNIDWNTFYAFFEDYKHTH